jgi:hypothetical protein
LTLDIGAPEGACDWHGVLRTPFGDRYAATKAITLERTWRSERGSELQLSLTRTAHTPDGFRLHVPPGTWNVSVAFTERDRWHSPATLTAGHSKLEWDLVIPGTRISGMLLDSTTAAPLQAPRGSEHVRVRRFLHEDDPDPDHDAVVGADGTYTLLVHGTGDWVLSAEPLPLAQVRHRLTNSRRRCIRRARTRRALVASAIRLPPAATQLG